MRHSEDQELKMKKKTPLWKWIVIIFLVIAMPLFFSFARNMQIQQALINSNADAPPKAMTPDELNVSKSP